MLLGSNRYVKLIDSRPHGRPFFSTNPKFHHITAKVDRLVSDRISYSTGTHAG